MKKLLVLTTVINIALIFIQLVMGISRSSDGDELATINSQLLHIHEQNQQLQSLIYSKSSLSHIESAAINIGMVQIPTTQLSPSTVAQTKYYRP